MLIDENLKYNYVFFNAQDNKLGRDNTGYYTICAKDLEYIKDVKVVSGPLDYSLYIIRLLFAIHHSKKINKFIKLPFKKLWYKYYFKNDFYNDKQICFIVSGGYVTVDYLKFLKKKYPNAKFVKLFRDKRVLFFECRPDYDEKMLNDYFDLVMSFDEVESKKFGMVPFVQFESKIDIETIEEYKCDVFFAGKAKDRLNLLFDIYDKLTQEGIRCNFYLTEVPENRRVKKEGIEYAESGMSYYRMLQRTINCKCLLEINQSGLVGFTSRFLEAVMYSKKLLTNNSFVKKAQYYNPTLIKCFETIDDINVDFILNDDLVDYNYDNGFSPVNLVKKIDSILP